MRRLALLLAVGLVALPAPGHAATMKFTVAYSGSAHYLSYRDAFGCLKQNEEDRGEWSVLYDLRLPRSGPVDHQIGLAGEPVGHEVKDGYRTWGQSTCGDGSGPFDCTGDLEPDLFPSDRQKPVLAIKPRRQGTSLRIRVDPPWRWQAKGIHGSGRCADDPTDVGFFPAEQDDLPDMLQANLTVDVSDLRDIARGRALTIPVKSRPGQLPAADCSTSLTQCHQVLDPWKGKVVVRRTS